MFYLVQPGGRRGRCLEPLRSINLFDPLHLSLTSRFLSPTQARKGELKLEPSLKSRLISVAPQFGSSPAQAQKIFSNFVSSS